MNIFVLIDYSIPTSSHQDGCPGSRPDPAASFPGAAPHHIARRVGRRQLAHRGVLFPKITDKTHTYQPLNLAVILMDEVQDSENYGLAYGYQLR